VTRLTVSVILLCVVVTSYTVASPDAENSAQQLSNDPRTARALDWLEKNGAWVTEQHIRITEVPAPPFQETGRGALLRKLLEPYGLRMRVDEVGNIVGERPGANGKGVVLLTAHMDTVFPAGMDVRVRREGHRLLAPGIADNGAGLAGLVAVARAMQEAKLPTELTVVFAANVGEEGEGNLRGMRKLMETYRSRLRYVIALDGASVEHVITSALASQRVEVIVTGPGGHSWSDFGLPNPIDALARGIAGFVKVRLPEQPRTTFNVGEIQGGTSVNSIPYRATIKVDLRSESPAELERLEKALREAIQQGVNEENAAGRWAGAGLHEPGARLEVKFHVLGVRPGGELPADSPLLAAVRSADNFLGIRSHLDRSSTDANLPLSLGIPAIAIGAGGNGGAVHSPAEWYDPADRELGLKRILLTLLGVAAPPPKGHAPTGK
jgi:acetylornithine deacetylase/succinyl-diaminopimelate desuccinylase-like protein